MKCLEYNKEFYLLDFANIKKRIENTIVINYLIASKWNSFKPKQLSLYGIIALLEFIKLAIYNVES